GGVRCGNGEIWRGWRDFQGAVGRVETLGLVFQVVSRVLCKRFLGSVASLGGAGSALIGCLGVQTQTTLVQMAALRTGHHYLCGGLVFAILPFLSGRRGTPHRAGHPRRPHHYLALGSVLRARIEQTMPPEAEAHQRLLAGG